MSINVKLDADGNCNLCKNTSLPNEHVECFICNSSFHAVCSSINNEDKMATKTTVVNFLMSSTKKNFMFLCNICLTNLERSNADSESQRINTLESKIDSMDNHLSEIKKLLIDKGTAPAPEELPKETVQPKNNTSSIWFNKEKLATVKAPPVPSVLVLGKTKDSDKDKKYIELVEKVIMDNNITLQDTYRTKDGELVLVCDSKESRDNLSNIVKNSDGNIPTKTPNSKSPAITIVGVPKEYNHSEITEMFVKQNEFVKRFAMANIIDDHFKVLAVRTTKKNPDIFQVFATVSAVLRDGIKQFKDRITLGLTSCKVYDQYHVKRCYKCQHFGHYSKDCTSPEQFCAKCGEYHTTNTCFSTVKKCIICVRSGTATHDHFAYDSNCPSMLKQQELLKRNLAKSNLNVTRYKTTQTT